MGPRRPPPLRDRPLDISTLTLVPQQRLRPNKSFKKSKTTDPTHVPSKPRTASSASLGSSNSTNAKPGGFLATHTFLKGPYLLNALSISCLLADEPKLPTYTLQDKSHSR